MPVDLARLQSGWRVAIDICLRQRWRRVPTRPWRSPPEERFTGGRLESDVPRIAEVSGTNGPTPPTVSVLPGIQLNNLGLLAGGTGAGTFLIATPFVNDAVFGLDNIDLTTSPLTLGTSLSTKSGANYLTFGPDGCIYGSQAATVFKITDAAGDCDYGAALGSPTLVLSPASVSPNPAQGTSQTFDATLHYASPLAGTQVVSTSRAPIRRFSR